MCTKKCINKISIGVEQKLEHGYTAMIILYEFFWFFREYGYQSIFCACGPTPRSLADSLYHFEGRPVAVYWFIFALFGVNLMRDIVGIF